MKPLDCLLRQSVLERDDYKCQKCDSENNLDVHHLIPESVNGPSEINNLVTLCRSCHRRAHTVMGPGRYKQPSSVSIQPTPVIAPTLPVVINQKNEIVIREEKEKSYYLPVRILKGGQVFIPRTIREALHLEIGDIIDVTFTKIAKSEKEESPLARA